MGGRREVSIIAHRLMASSDLKQERSFFSCECLFNYATGCSSGTKSILGHTWSSGGEELGQRMQAV